MPNLDPSLAPLLEKHADAIIEVAHDLAKLGWTPATSGNFSMRLDPGHVAITASGRDKGELTREDILVIDMAGQLQHGDGRPSAETRLHTQIYGFQADTQAVLHTHSRTQSVASRLFADAGVIHLQGWELLKAIDGIHSHDGVLELPVFPNTQDMSELASSVEAWRDAGNPLHAYLINGHGMYAWGTSMAAARRHLQALDFLLACKLDLKRLHS